MAKLFVYPQQYTPDLSGIPMMGAKLYFYQIGTSTPKDTFVDGALLQANEHPVQADAYGVMPVIWLDESGSDYRMVLTDAGDVPQKIVDGLLSSTESLSGAGILSALSDVDGTGSGLDADLLDGIDSIAFAQKAQSQNITGFWQFDAVAGSNPWAGGGEIGWRRPPQVLKTAYYVLDKGDVGKEIVTTTGGIGINPHVTGIIYWGIVPGDVFLVYNDSAVNQTISAVNPGVTILRIPGTATTGTRTLAQRGIAVCHKIKSDEWLIYGQGVT